MEETNSGQYSQPTPEVTAPPAPTFSPPGASSSKKGGKGWGIVLVIFALVLIVGGGLYFMGKNKKDESGEPLPTQAESYFVEDETPEPEDSPEPEVDKAEISVEIQNGTGIPKEASFLSDKLKALGFEKITAGNAPTTDYKVTEVVFSSDLSLSLVNEVTDELEKIYQDVSTSKNSSASVDIKIITGLRKGSTPRPSASATPKASASPTASSSPSPSPTPSN